MMLLNLSQDFLGGIGLGLGGKESSFKISVGDVVYFRW